MHALALSLADIGRDNGTLQSGCTVNRHSDGHNIILRPNELHKLEDIVKKHSKVPADDRAYNKPMFRGTVRNI